VGAVRPSMQIQEPSRSASATEDVSLPANEFDTSLKPFLNPTRSILPNRPAWKRTPKMPMKLDLNLMGLPVCLIDVCEDGFRFAGLNDAATRVCGLENAAVAGRLVEECLPPAQAERLVSRYRSCTRTGRMEDFEQEVDFGFGRRWFRTSLTPLSDPDTGLVTRLMSVSQEFTATKRLQRELEQLAFQDALTALPNRRRFDQATAERVAQAACTHKGFSIAVVDLNELKSINDTHGHRIGDEAIRHAARILSGLMRPRELVARIGGDEFALLLGADTRGELDRRLDEIRNFVACRLETPVGPLRVALSVGGEVWALGHDVYDTFAAADAAMYREKQIHRLVRRFDGRAA